MSTIAIGVTLLVALLVTMSWLRKDETISMPMGGGPPPPPHSIEALILAGRKIEAIKLLREGTHLGLKEAKEEVEAIQERLRHG